MAQIDKNSGDQPEALASDLLWTVEEIAEAIGRSRRQAFHMLQNGRLPARKIGAH